MKKILILIFSAVLFLQENVNAQEKKTAYPPTATYQFAQRDTLPLFVDFYKASEKSVTSIDGKQKPAVIFMFGGGFIWGVRNGEEAQTWFKVLNEQGYPVFAIDYRLGMKGVQAKGFKLVDAIENAILMGVEDLYSATDYIIRHEDEFNVRPENLVISGSSAGAMIALQAEYEICQQSPLTKILPEGFNYAGIMSFSGGIFTRKGKLKFPVEPCPTLMFHGTEDELVPYGQIRFFNIGFYGSDKITKKMAKEGYNYNTYRFVGNKHEIAGSMRHTIPEQLRFLETNVTLKKHRIKDVRLNDPVMPIDPNRTRIKDLY